MKIHRFTDDPALTQSFIRFGYELYQDDARWIPPFRAALKEQLSPRTGLSRGPADDAMHFVATHRDRVVGRVSAMVNSKLRVDGAPVGIIGFFECIDDVGIAAALFSAARSWLHEEHGLDHVWGPMNFDIWHDYRLMTRGFDLEPFSGEPWNKDYYPALFERCGWQPLRKWESIDIDRRGVEQTIEWGTPRHRKVIAAGYRFRDIDPRRFDDELITLHRILSDSFSGFLGFTPISPEEFRRGFSKLRHALVPGWCTFIDDPQGELAGFCCAFLDLGDAIRAMRGETNALARIRFAWHRRRARRAIFYVVGLTPAEAATGSGLGRAAVCQIARQLGEDQVDSVVAALMVADGRARSRVAGRNTAEAQREYTLYEIES